MSAGSQQAAGVSNKLINPDEGWPVGKLEYIFFIKVLNSSISSYIN